MRHRPGILRFFPGALLTLATSSACGQTVSEGSLLYWGFDKAFLGSVKAGHVDLTPIDLHGRIQTIISVSVAGRVAAISGRERPGNRPAVFLLDWPSARISRTLDREVYQVALEPSAERLAFTTYAGAADNDDSADVSVRDLTTGKEVVLARRKGLPGALTWRPGTKALTFDFQRVLSRSVDRDTGVITRSLRSSIETVDLESGEVTPLYEGSAPAWSPDGRKLAYRRGKTVLVYDAAEGKSSKPYSRGRRQSDFVGNIYWSPKGDYLALNATAGVMGQGLECLVIEVGSGRAISLGKGSYSCGPWLETGTSVASRRAPSN